MRLCVSPVSETFASVPLRDFCHPYFAPLDLLQNRLHVFSVGKPHKQRVGGVTKSSGRNKERFAIGKAQVRQIKTKDSRAEFGIFCFSLGTFFSFGLGCIVTAALTLLE